MPQRKLSYSAPKRLKALRTAKDLKDAVPAPLVVPFTAATIERLDLFYPAYKLKVEAMEAALQAQTSVTGTVTDVRPLAEVNISSFYSAMQYAVRRKIFDKSVRAFYGLAVSDENLPRLKSEADIVFWGEKATIGEAARVAAGGAPITFPSIAEVNMAVNNFKNPNLQQAAAKNAYDMAQEAVEADTPECDKLILKMWNEIETAFDEGNKPSMRRKAREWGVVYVPNPGEAPSPDDFSIMGTVTDSATGNPIADATVILTDTDVVEQTDAQGKYLIAVQPAGIYNLKIYKNGYGLKDVSGVTITEGAITTVNAALQPGVETGSVKGRVLQTGMPVPATVSVDGYPISASTDPMGNYVLNEVPSGNQNIRAELQSNPGNPQTMMVNVMVNDSVIQDFNF